MTRDQLAMWLVDNGMAEDGAWSSDAEEKADVLLKHFMIVPLPRNVLNPGPYEEDA
jgi:hypothetical protein